ncbi:MAG: 50S ribosomal protein L25/general stress protein Ctc [Rickettsiaceae bacterium H1]|nr:50S ribosomal protein L25/general stress protein Ctc [Rickettsiaceae bacterium H1]
MISIESIQEKKMISIKAEKRLETGSFATRNHRKKGMIPANFYGKGVKNINLLVNTQEIAKIQSKRNCCLISLEIDGKAKSVLMQDIQYHPVTMEPLHADFFAVNKKQEIKVNIPLRYLNTEKSPGIKKGGHLNKIYRRLPLFSLSDKIPECIEIDIGNFDIGKIIKMSDIKLPEDVKPILAESVVICNIMGRISKRKSKEEGEESPQEGNKQD